MTTATVVLKFTIWRPLAVLMQRLAGAEVLPANSPPPVTASTPKLLDEMLARYSLPVRYGLPARAALCACGCGQPARERSIYHSEQCGNRLRARRSRARKAEARRLAAALA